MNFYERRVCLYNRKNHSKYLIKYHIIFVCKYRKKLLVKLGSQIKDTMTDISNKYDFFIESMEVDKDHIHMLISSEPKISPLQIVRVLKQQSTINIWKTNKLFLAKHFLKEKTFWSDGYFCTSIGDVSEETLKKYIKNQG